MEKKNTILLTVIAVATLLVAVVGATFAYFTATIETQNEENSTTTIQTKTIATATMDYGKNVSASNVLPGYKVVKSVNITGKGTADDLPVNGTITLTPSVTDFGSHIKYTLYKVSGASAPDAGTICTASNQIVDGEKYYDSMTCDPTSLGTPVIAETAFTGTTPVTQDVTVTYNTNDTYYVLIEYENDTTADQNSERGKTFTVDINFTAKAGA